LAGRESSLKGVVGVELNETFFKPKILLFELLLFPGQSRRKKLGREQFLLFSAQRGSFVLAQQLETYV
jgi:hypothetical protein